MSKWKCEICGDKFENFHAQGFNNKIYCPLCFFKEENKRLKEQLKQRDEVIDEAINHLDCFISDVNLSKYDTLKILMHAKKILTKYKGDNNE